MKKFNVIIWVLVLASVLGNIYLYYNGLKIDAELKAIDAELEAYDSIIIIDVEKCPPASQGCTVIDFSSSENKE